VSALLGADGRPLRRIETAKNSTRCEGCGGTNITNEAGFGGHVTRVCLTCGADQVRCCEVSE
jgi:hypothetical protein